jgi:hypothetical protein
MIRIWHPYTEWEDYKHGMWATFTGQNKKQFLDKAVLFTGDAVLYGSWMIEVVKHWRIGCEHNLTDVSINRRAWVGHAACCLAIGCPENITREAWGQLTDKQRNEANAMADKAIIYWEENESKNTQLHLDLGKARIS